MFVKVIAVGSRFFELNFSLAVLSNSYHLNVKLIDRFLYSHRMEIEDLPFQQLLNFYDDSIDRSQKLCHLNGGSLREIIFKHKQMIALMSKPHLEV